MPPRHLAGHTLAQTDIHIHRHRRERDETKTKPFSINKADAEKTSAKWRARQCDQFFRPPTAKTQCLGLLFVFFSPTAVASARVQQANASRRGGVCCQAALEWAMRAVWLSSLTPHRADVTRWERNRSHKRRRRRRRPLRSIQSLWGVTVTRYTLGEKTTIISNCKKLKNYYNEIWSSSLIYIPLLVN